MTTLQEVTYIHSCECGKPIDCTGDDIYMGTPICSHFYCEPCAVADYIKHQRVKVDIKTGNSFRHSMEHIQAMFYPDYQAPLESKLEPDTRRSRLTKDEYLLDVATGNPADRKSWPYYEGPVGVRRND